jgi:uncharacterized C2H2 Zn-finger protein
MARTGRPGFAATGKKPIGAISKKAALVPRYAYGSTSDGSTSKKYVPPPTLDYSVDRSFVCPEIGCVACYSSAAGLYQHKRAYHPELVASRAGGAARYDDDDERRFECPDCDKAYGSSQGLYQHKRAKHPWLINERARGYTRPMFHKNRALTND